MATGRCRCHRDRGLRRRECRRAQSRTSSSAQYHIGGNDREIVVTVARGHCDKVTDVRAQEGATSVAVTVLVERPRGTCTADIVFDDIPIILASPLGGREVTNQEGAALPLSSR